MNNLKVLVLYTDFGAGHSLAAKQLKKRLEVSLDNSEIYIKNTKKESSPFMTKLIEKIYMNFFTKYADNILVDKLYGSLFYLANVIYPINYFLVQKTGEKCTKKFIVDNEIDLVICTYPYRIDTEVPVLVCLTDYECFQVWKLKNNDFYLVNDIDNVDFLRKKGICNGNVFLSGIQLDEQFYNVNNKVCVKRVLFNLGARGQGSFKNISLNIDKLLSSKLEISIMCGKNKELYNRLGKKYGNKIVIYSFINNVYDVVRDSDLIITKAGGISISECIQSEKPIVVNLSQTLDGQELGNYRYILKKEIGEGSNESKLYDIVLSYVNDPEKYLKKVNNIKILKDEMNSSKNIEDIIEGIL